VIVSVEQNILRPVILPVKNMTIKPEKNECPYCSKEHKTFEELEEHLEKIHRLYPLKKRKI